MVEDVCQRPYAWAFRMDSRLCHQSPVTFTNSASSSKIEAGVSGSAIVPGFHEDSRHALGHVKSCVFHDFVIIGLCDRKGKSGGA